jgi:hypothetical protein
VRWVSTDVSEDLQGRPWRWRRCVSPKHRLTLNGLHGVISQRMTLFISHGLVKGKKKDKVVPAPWRRMGSGRIDPRFLDLGTSWRWVVSFTPRPLYPRGKSPRYPFERRLGGPQSQPGWRDEEKILDPTGLELWPLGRPARSQSLYRLRYPGSSQPR